MFQRETVFISRLRLLTQLFTLFTALAVCSVNAQTIVKNADNTYNINGPNDANSPNPTYKATINNQGVLVSYQTLNPLNNNYREFFHTKTGNSLPDGVLFSYVSYYNSVANALASAPPPAHSAVLQQRHVKY